MRSVRGVFAVICLGGLLFGCSRSYTEEDLSRIQESETKQAEQQSRQEKMLIETNKVLLAKEQDRIASYIERRGWKMTQSEGVFVGILEKGNGKGFASGETLRVEYECELLTGEKVLSSKEDGDLVLLVGKGGDCPLALQRAIEKMSDGCKARVIVPYNLAYGLVGDGNKIPKAASLVYELKVYKTKK